MSKLIVDSKQLLSNLKQLAPAVSKNPTIPVLENVRINVSNKVAEITATNLNITIVLTMECETDEDISLLLPYVELTNICNEVNGPITIENKANQIVLTNNKDVFKLGKPVDIKNFPESTSFESTLSLDVDSLFFNALDQALKSASSMEFDLKSNVCIDFEKDCVKVVSTDNASMYLHNFKNTSSIKHEALINPDFVRAIRDFQDAKVMVNDKSICIKSPNKQVFSNLSEHKYLAYNMIFTKCSEKVNCTINKKDLESAIRKVLVYKNPLKLYLCDFTFLENQILIQYTDSNFERGTDILIPVSHTVDYEKISFNAKQLQIVLSQLPAETENIHISFSGQKTPAIIKGDTDDEITLLIMPCMPK